jgi:hypothetical protein
MKGFLHKQYKNWMAENRHRFKYQPKVIEQTKNMLMVGFDGLNPKLSFYLNTSRRNKNGLGRYIGAMLVYESERFDSFDILWDGDLREVRTKEGHYYCDLCLTRHVFESREALWNEHIFEELLIWVNALGPEKILVESGYKGELGFKEQSWWCHIQLASDEITGPNSEVFPLVTAADECVNTSKKQSESS